MKEFINITCIFFFTMFRNVITIISAFFIISFILV